MSNSIEAAKRYIAALDRAYKAASKSSVLDVNPAFVREADVAGTFYLPKLTLVGLGTYSTTDGFPTGDATLAWTAYTYSQDRGRKFSIDSVEDAEAASAAFGNVASEFMRMHEVPEIDAYRFATIATSAGTDASGTLSDAASVVSALNTAMDALDEAEVPDEDKVLFITAGLLRLARNAASTAATTDALDRATVVVVPQTRFYTGITVDAGATGSAGGYSKNGVDINFILMARSAAFCDAKHVALRTFSPEQNQTADAWLYQFRVVHDCWLYDNKDNGVYVHTKAS